MTAGRLMAVFLTLILEACGASDSLNTTLSRIVGFEQIRVLPVNARFLEIRDLVKSEGSLWVLDGGPPFLAHIDMATGEIVQFAAEGDGPGELRDPWAIQATISTGSSGVLVWDFDAGWVSEFDRAGQFVESARLDDQGRIRARSDIKQVSFGDPFRVRSDGQGFLAAQFPGRIDRTGDLGAGVLHRVNRTLSPGADLARFSDHMARGVSNLQEWSAVPFWDACDGMVVLWSPGSTSVVWLESEGEVRAEVPVPLPATPLGPQDRERYLEWMARLELGPDFEKAGIDFTDMARTHRDRFAESQPIVTDLRCESREVAIHPRNQATDHVHGSPQG